MNITGLDENYVKTQIEKGNYNKDTQVKTKSIKSIILANTLTLFNFLNLFLGLGIFLVGSYKNLSFLVVIFLNTLISIIQEIQAKKIIDKLSLISNTKALVIRNSKEKLIDKEEIIKGDIIVFKTGDQILVDSIIVAGEVEVNESLITGEEDAILKGVGDTLLSGSYITSGKSKCEVINVGYENYVSKLTAKAKKDKKVESEIKNSLAVILKFISYIIIPLGIILFIKQWFVCDKDLTLAIIKTTAALIGMIPEGLVLLTSTVMALSAIRLAKYKVLVQQMYCIENLARVDTICLDKTGTLTEGKMQVYDVIYKKDKKKCDEILNAICFYSKDSNATILALKDYFKGSPTLKEEKNIPFNSKNKYSGSVFFNSGAYYIGALEFLDIKETIDLETYQRNYRTLVLSHNGEVWAIILLQDVIRSEAYGTLEYFDKQGVDLKIISGDHPTTVMSIAKRCGFMNDNAIDMSKTKLPIATLASEYNIFGRVTPEQKKDLIKELKRQGHMVAYTGDGVNDVLALREANLSIAMASGSDAARNVSDLILLDSNFDALPNVLNEGRRNINNLERSASLFLTKTIYSLLLAILFVFIAYPYPFMPVQLTLTSIFTIGIPSFFLALEPNYERIKGNFLVNVISKSIPAALTIVLNIILIVIFTYIFKLDFKTSSTLCVVMVATTGFILIYWICHPFTPIRKFLMIILLFGFFAGVIGFKNFLSLVHLNIKMVTIILLLFSISLWLFYSLTRVTKKILKYYQKKGILKYE